MSDCILDASAILALLYQEPGAEAVREILLADTHAIGSVNLAEVVGKARDGGMPLAEVGEMLAALNLHVIPFDHALALIAGDLRAATRAHGLSLGDRACLALALSRGASVITADRPWLQLAKTLKLDIRCIRPG